MTAKEARLRKHTRRERARRRRAKPGTQLEIGMPETFTWGGHREGACRPPGPRPRTRHEPREPFAAWAPEHLTIRLAGGLPALGDELLFLIFAGGVDAVHRRRPRSRSLSGSVERAVLDGLEAPEAVKRGEHGADSSRASTRGPGICRQLKRTQDLGGE